VVATYIYYISIIYLSITDVLERKRGLYPQNANFAVVRSNSSLYLVHGGEKKICVFELYLKRWKLFEKMSEPGVRNEGGGPGKPSCITSNINMSSVSKFIVTYFC
jgi:hypothetical protein